MKPKFEIGDRVIYKPDNYVGTINGIDRDTDGYSILYDDGEERYVHENDLEFVNPKNAFLTRLQELLATFDVCIDSSYSDKYCCDYPCIHINGEELYYFDGIFAENVFDYDKD